jgi:hypothetical protein
MAELTSAELGARQGLTVMLERRRHPRNAARQRAHIVLSGLRPPIPCIIRETSPFGALVEHRADQQFPERFHLLAEGTLLLACRLVGQTPGTLEVEYIRP